MKFSTQAIENRNNSGFMWNSGTALYNHFGRLLALGSFCTHMCWSIFQWIFKKEHSVDLWILCKWLFSLCLHCPVHSCHLVTCRLSQSCLLNPGRPFMSTWVSSYEPWPRNLLQKVGWNNLRVHLIRYSSFSFITLYSISWVPLFDVFLSQFLVASSGRLNPVTVPPPWPWISNWGEF